MTGDNNGFQIWKKIFSGKPTKNFIHQIVRRELAVTRSNAARAPTVAGATPIDFVLSKRIAAATSVVGRKTRRDNDRVIECAGEKSRGQCGPKIVIGIAS